MLDSTNERTRITCDYEGCKARIPITGYATMVAALRHARGRGWTQVRDNRVYRDYCPEHSE